MDQHARVDHDRNRLLEAAAPIVADFPGVIWMPFKVKPKRNGRFDKMPALGCKTNDPASWFTLDAAIDALEQYPALAGIGFAIPDGLITLDYDNCRDRSTGQLDFEAQSAVTQCNSYAYATISGRGLRIVGLNNAKAPLCAGKYTMVTLAGQKIEVFIGQTNHFNTLAADVLPGPRELKDLSGFTSNLLGERLDEEGNARPREDLDDLDARIPLPRICDTLGKLPNPDGPEFGWDWWNRVAAAVHRCTGGSQEGLEAFDAWSAKSERYCQGETPDQRWDGLTKSPMTAINYGTLVYLVRTTPGGDPGFRAPKSKRMPTGDRTFQRFDEVKVTPTDDFVEGLLESDSVAMIFGPPGAGKTFFVLDLLLHVAWGRTWFDRAIEQGPALLFALESRRGVERRIAAFRHHYRLKGENLPFAVSFDPVDLSDPDSVKTVVQAIRAQAQAFGAPIKVVAIDTLAAALGGDGDENSAEVMNPVLANCHWIREKTGCCLILVHHPGKNAARGPRGFSGIGGTVSTLIEIDYPERGKPRQVSVRKQRDLEIGEEDMFYRLKVVEVGFDPKRGKPITSCVVAPILDTSERATAAARAKLAKLTPQQRMALDALREALEEHGKDTSNGKPPARVTTMLAWRNALKARSPGVTTAAVRMALARSHKALLKLQLIGVKGDQVWLLEEAE